MRHEFDKDVFSRMADEQEINARRKRINRLKKAIVSVIISAILIPLVASIVLACLYFHSQKELKNVQTQYEQLLESMEQLRDSIEYEAPSTDVYSTSEVEISSRDNETDDIGDEVSEDDENADSNENVKHVYLTFDDGPSSNTERILDVLKEYDVKATFFVVGKTDETSVAAYKRIVDEGHTLGMHSYSHKYSQVYSSEEAFANDLHELQEYLYEVTGVWSRYYRFPGGSSNTAASVDMDMLITYLLDQGISYYDWNIVSGDATGKAISAESIFENCTSRLDKYDDAFILMHDAAAKNSTVEALPMIIEKLQDMDNVVISAIDDDTIPVRHRVVE